MRITIKKEILEWYIEPKIVFYKDDIEFCRLSPTIVEDIQCWAGLSKEDSILEVTQILKNELKDPSLDHEIDILIEQIKNYDNK